MEDEEKPLSRQEHFLVRLISLLKLMERSEGTYYYFANVLGVNVRTVQRDVELLRNAGFPISYNTYTQELTLISNYSVPSIEFSQTEVLAVLVLFEEFGASMDEPVFSAVTSAAYKIASMLSPGFLDLVGKIQHCVKVNPPHADIGKGHTDSLQSILDAILYRRVVTMQYQSPMVPGCIETSLHPYTVLFGRSWYVVGFSTLYREVRTFKISRIKMIKSTSETFTMPATFSLSEYLGNAWNLIPEKGPDEDVIIRFSTKVAQNAAEIRWHKTQEIRWLENGQVELRFKVSGLNEILWWVLGYGAEAEVIHPQRLREMIADHVKRLSEMY